MVECLEELLSLVVALDADAFLFNGFEVVLVFFVFHFGVEPQAAEGKALRIGLGASHLNSVIIIIYKALTSSHTHYPHHTLAESNRCIFSWEESIINL